MRYNQLTKDIVNSRLVGRGIVLTGDYIDARTRTSFICSKNHEWCAAPSTVLNVSGCPVCSKRKPLTVNDINERLKDRGIELIGEVITTNKPALFRCQCGHEWMTTPGNIMKGRGCAQCAHYGFKTNRSAYAYVIVFDTFIKYGITNDIKTRLYRHKNKNGNFTIGIIKSFGCGQDALNWERMIKTTYGGSFATKESCKDGYTETLDVSLLNEVKSTL